MTRQTPHSRADRDLETEWDYLDEEPAPRRRGRARKRSRRRTNAAWHEGMVIHGRGHEYDVQLAEGPVRCTVAGRFYQTPNPDTLIAVGDRVRVQTTNAGRGVIEDIRPRSKVLSRQRPFVSYPAEDVILSNPDQLIPVMSIAEPAPRPAMLDRYLVLAAAYELKVLICVTKIDLTGRARARRHFGRYEQLGYEVVYTGLDSTDGLQPLRQACRGRISVLSGPSGVGKSTLLNRLEPDLNLKVGAVRAVAGKGAHTTRATRLLPLSNMPDSYIADTPGIREMRLFGIAANELPLYFVDIAALHNQCPMTHCLHDHEPGCMVRQAAADGRLHPARYDSYLRLLHALDQPLLR